MLVYPFYSCFRWEVIANYMNLHSTTGIKRTAKDVINKAKSLQKLGIYITLFLKYDGLHASVQLDFL